MGNQSNSFGSSSAAPIIPGAEEVVFSAVDTDASTTIDTEQYGSWQLQVELTTANPQACAQITLETKLASSSNWSFLEEHIFAPGEATTKSYTLTFNIFLDDTRISFHEVVDGCTITANIVGANI